jgi:hypothetical protein
LREAIEGQVISYTDSYYVHYSGQEVADITQPFEVRLGNGSEAIVSFPSATDRG